MLCEILFDHWIGRELEFGEGRVHADPYCTVSNPSVEDVKFVQKAETGLSPTKSVVHQQLEREMFLLQQDQPKLVK
jgi:hypothetical protein